MDMNGELIQRLLNPTFDPEEAQHLMREAAVRIEQQSHTIKNLYEQNLRLRDQVSALVLDLGIKNGHYLGRVQ